jgi:hypothetical protein
MATISRFDQFLNEAFLNKDKEKVISRITAYIKSRTGVEFYPYDEIWHIQKKSVFLRGQLFVSLRNSRAIRLNWMEGVLSSEIHSIDLWEDFGFETKPDFTLNTSTMSVAQFLPSVADFVNDPKAMLVEAADDLRGKLADVESKLRRARTEKSRAAHKQAIDRLTAQLADQEKADLESQKVTQLDIKIDVFKSIELYTMQVAKGRSNSLIVSGDAGVGKTRTVRDTLESMGMAKDVNYYFATGTATTAGLYETLFLHRHKLIVFDDCDAVFKDPDSVNILKGALDTYKVREISKLTKGNTFDSTGMEDMDMQSEFETTKKLPNKFEFDGQIIFISNLPEDKFDRALLSRALHVDVHLNKQELFDRMKEIMRKICPDVDMETKEEALEYLMYITTNFPTKFDMNIRTLIHSINLRAHNEGTIALGDREEPIWKLLIKKYLVKTK